MKAFRPIFFVALLVLCITSQASADIIILDTPSFVQPEENLLLQGTTGLITTGMTVQGITNQTDTIFNITGNEILTLPSNGQARVEATTGNFSFATFDAADPLIYFTLFEANVNVAGSPLITVRATELNGTPTLYTYTGTSGQNFFGVRAFNGQLIDYITISTAPNESIEDIRQIRVGGIVDPPVGESTPVPEPASLLLMGTGLGIIGIIAARRKK